jgi:nucleoside phosphorylase
MLGRRSLERTGWQTTSEVVRGVPTRWQLIDSLTLLIDCLVPLLVFRISSSQWTNESMDQCVSDKHALRFAPTRAGMARATREATVGLARGLAVLGAAMFFVRRHTPSWLRTTVVAALAFSLCACGSDDRDAEEPLFLAVLSAFPAEIAPLVEQAVIEETVEIEGRVFRAGTLRGVRVVLGLTGIGLLSAETVTRAVLERFPVTGVVVSGVAGSFLRIGDVTVPEVWTLGDGTSYGAHPPWIDLAAEIAASGGVPLERCTVLPRDPSRDVCLPYEPAIAVEGTGRSAGFESSVVPCLPDGDDVFGCDIVDGGGAASARPYRVMKSGVGIQADAPIAEDMETAAIAREAAARGIPFIAFRAASDGEGDPLMLPGFPAQFFAYYRLAARNAAAAAIAFVERLGAGE